MVRFTDKLIWILERIVIIMIISVVILISMQIFMRYVVSHPLSWTEQISRYIFIWMVMLGIPIMFHKRIFMSFDLIFDKLPTSKRKVLTIIIKICVCAFAVFYFTNSSILCLKTWGRLTAGVKMPLFLVYGAQPVSAIFIFIVTFNQLLIEFKNGNDNSKQNTTSPDGATL